MVHHTFIKVRANALNEKVCSIILFQKYTTSRHSNRLEFVRAYSVSKIVEDPRNASCPRPQDPRTAICPRPQDPREGIRLRNASCPREEFRLLRVLLEKPRMKNFLSTTSALRQANLIHLLVNREGASAVTRITGL